MFHRKITFQAHCLFGNIGFKAHFQHYIGFITTEVTKRYSSYILQKRTSIQKHFWPHILNRYELMLVKKIILVLFIAYMPYFWVIPVTEFLQSPAPEKIC